MAKDLCDHRWNYAHTVYEGHVIRRWCYECGKREVGVVKTWRPEKRDEFDHPPHPKLRSKESSSE